MIAFELKKEEMGEVLHEVDFSQLKIENKQYLTKIEKNGGHCDSKSQLSKGMIKRIINWMNKESMF